MLSIDLSKIPNVLFLGSGLVLLSGGKNWTDLLSDMNSAKKNDLSHIPFAMRPEVIFDAQIEDAQKEVAKGLKTVEAHDILKRLLSLSFDAMLTTNYTYEIEQVLSEARWTETRRQKSFRPLHGSSHAHLNTSICNLVKMPNGREIPVFHIHGELRRTRSLVLSYYSYAKATAKLNALNTMRGNQYREKQGERLDCWSWLDYFILGEVYAIGYGFDLSEFDVWWAIERKAREKAKHGKLHAFLADKKENRFREQITLLNALDAGAELRVGEYESIYREFLSSISEEVGKTRFISK